MIVPVSSHLTPKDISQLTLFKQRILFSLLKEEKCLSRLVEDVKADHSTIFRALNEFLIKRDYVEKDSNKVYRLTRHGKILCFTLAPANNMAPNEVASLFDRILREVYEITDEKYRNEIIETWIDLNKIFYHTFHTDIEIKEVE